MMFKPEDYTGLERLDDPRRLFDLSGRTGLILGGGGKMAQQFARVLIRAGANLILADLTSEAVEAAASEVEDALGVRPQAKVCNTADQGSIDGLFSDLEEKHDRLDFLIYNVMAKPEGYYRPFEKYPRETWEAVMAGNTGGAFFSCQRAAGLLRRGQGSVVLTSSIYGLLAPDFRIYEGSSPVGNIYGGTDPLTAPASYAASKGGIEALAKYLAVLLAPDGIRVNTLVPGGVYDGQERVFHDHYAARVPLGRMAEWSDFNGAILFLVSDASRYVTGTRLVVDGGWSAW